MSDTIGRAAVREWLREHKTISSLGREIIARDFDRKFPPPAPPLPRCHYCGGLQERDTLIGGDSLLCLTCRRRWYAAAPHGNDVAQLAAEYDRPVRLAEARGRVDELDLVLLETDPTPHVVNVIRGRRERRRAELARLESEGGPT